MTMIFLGNRLSFQVIEHFVDLRGLGREGVEQGARLRQLLLELGPRGGVAVVQVVHQLVGDAEFVAEVAELMAVRLIERRSEQTGPGGELEQGRRLQLSEATGGGAGRGEVHGLAADEGVAVEHAQKFLLEAAQVFGLGGAGDPFGGMAGGEGDEAEGGEHGGRFAKLTVDGGLAAAHHLVVHAGQVVDNERGAVEEFDGDGATGDQLEIGVGQAADAQGEDGTEPLSSVEDGKPHGGGDGIRSGSGVIAEDQFESVIDEVAVGDESRHSCRAHHDTP